MHRPDAPLAELAADLADNRLKGVLDLLELGDAQGPLHGAAGDTPGRPADIGGPPLRVARTRRIGCRMVESSLGVKPLKHSKEVSWQSR